MENAKIETKNVIVKKGIVYYIVKFIKYIISEIIFTLKFSIFGVQYYMTEINKILENKKKIKKLLLRNEIDNEVI